MRNGSIHNTQNADLKPKPESDRTSVRITTMHGQEIIEEFDLDEFFNECYFRFLFLAHPVADAVETIVGNQTSYVAVDWDGKIERT